MSSLIGQTVAVIPIKSGADMFHELFRDNPHHISNITPSRLQACKLHQGKFGTPGSLVEWHYFHDGKLRTAKQVIDEIDSENRTLVLNQKEGDLMELYKSFILTIKVDENNVVTWTMDYEKLNPSIPDPITLRDYFVEVTKDIDAHHLK